MAKICVLPLKSNSVDISGNSKDFTNINSTPFTQGWPTGSCANFNWTNNYFYRANDTAFNLSSMTCLIRIKQTTNTLTQRAFLFQKWTVNSQYYFGNPTINNLIRLQRSAWWYKYLDFNTSTQWTIWKWVRICFRFDWTNVKIYLNWLEKYSTSQWWSIATTTTWEAIWYQYNDGVWYYLWQMSEFVFDNSALSTASIKNDYSYYKGFF